MDMAVCGSDVFKALEYPYFSGHIKRTEYTQLTIQLHIQLKLNVCHYD